MELRDIQKRISKQFFSTIFINKRQNFYYFIGTHPHLYDGLDIDGLTINMINTYFYEWEVNPLHFEHRYTSILMQELGRYNNLKNIELSKQILELFTNKSNKTIITNAVRDSNTQQKSQAEQNQATNTTANTSSESTTKGADKELPMQSNGDDFEETVDWSDGASTINQTKNETETNNTIAASDKITKEDESELKELEKKLNNGTETYEAVESQAVILINNITKYLYQPKSIDYLIEKLKPAFYQIY